MFYGDNIDAKTIGSSSNLSHQYEDDSHSKYGVELHPFWRKYWDAVLGDSEEIFLRGNRDLGTGSTLPKPLKIEQTAREKAQEKLAHFCSLSEKSFENYCDVFVPLFVDLFGESEFHDPSLARNYFQNVANSIQDTGEQCSEGDKLLHLQNVLTREINRKKNSPAKINAEFERLGLPFCSLEQQDDRSLLNIRGEGPTDPISVPIAGEELKKFVDRWTRKRHELAAIERPLRRIPLASDAIDRALADVKLLFILGLLEECGVEIDRHLLSSCAKKFGENAVWEMDNWSNPNGHSDYFSIHHHRSNYVEAIYSTIEYLQKNAQAWIIGMNGGKVLDHLEKFLPDRMGRLLSRSVDGTSALPPLKFLLRANDRGVQFADFLTRIPAKYFSDIFWGLRNANVSMETLYSLLMQKNSHGKTALFGWLGRSGEPTQKILKDLMMACDFTLDRRDEFLRPFLEELISSAEFPSDQFPSAQKACQLLGIKTSEDLRHRISAALKDRFFQKNNLGNCFVVSLLIRFQREQPEVLARLMIDLLTQGKTLLGIGRNRLVEMPLNLNFTGPTDLHSILEATLANQAESGQISYARCVLFSTLNASKILSPTEMSALKELLLFGEIQFLWHQELGRFESNRTVNAIFEKLHLDPEKKSQLLDYLKNHRTETFYLKERGDDFVFCLEGNDSDNAFRNIFHVDAAKPIFSSENPSAEKIAQTLGRIGRTYDLPIGHLIPLILADHEANAYIVPEGGLDRLGDGEILSIGETNWENLAYFGILKENNGFNFIGYDDKNRKINSDDLFSSVSLYNPNLCVLDLRKGSNL